MACKNGQCSVPAFAPKNAPRNAGCATCAEDRYRQYVMGAFNPWAMRNAGAVTSTTDAAGNITYTDDVTGSVITSDSQGNVISYTPETTGAQAAATDPATGVAIVAGQTAGTNIYDVAGRLITTAGQIITTQQANDAATAQHDADAATSLALNNALYANRGTMPPSRGLVNNTPPASSGGGSSLMLLVALGIGAALLGGVKVPGLSK